MKENIKLKPKMRKREIKTIEKQLLKLGEKGKINILEWGSGGSTVYFTQFLKQKNVQYNWLSIEYNKKWFKRVLQVTKNDKNTQIILLDVGNNQLRQRYVNMDEYVAYPRTIKRKFDFILVDGRKRRRCLIEVLGLLALNGTVFLHDAHRKYYRCALKNYPDSIFIKPHLWRGRIKNVSIIQKISNKIISLVNLFLARLETLFIKQIYSKIIILQKIKRKLFPNIHLDYVILFVLQALIFNQIFGRLELILSK